MTFTFEISDRLSKVLDRLADRDRTLAVAVRKKMEQIANCNHISIDYFKNLRGNMSSLKRVHIGSFVLTFQVIGDRILFEDLMHHDGAYG